MNTLAGDGVVEGVAIRDYGNALRGLERNSCDLRRSAVELMANGRSETRSNQGSSRNRSYWSLSSARIVSGLRALPANRDARASSTDYECST